MDRPVLNSRFRVFRAPFWRPEVPPIKLFSHAKDLSANGANCNLSPTWLVGARLRIDIGRHVADRVVHRGQGKTRHAIGLGNVVCPCIVALDVTPPSQRPGFCWGFREAAKTIVEKNKMRQGSWRRLWLRVHRDERGAVSLETILIVAAIALPILIFILKFGWPKIRDYFNQGMQNLENEGNNVTSGAQGGSGTGNN